MSSSEYLKTCLGSAGLVLLILQSMFCSFALLFRLVRRAAGRAATEIDNKTKSVQLKLKLPTGAKVSLAILKS
jgi:hypothetical protein